MVILEACDFHPLIGVKVLRERALITISDGKFDMHDLVQEMGHHIVRGEGAYHNEPERHSRVWKDEDVRTICSMDATTNVDMIEVIRFDNDPDDDDENLLGCLPPLVANTKSLRWIDWRGDLAGPLLTKFPPTKLCFLKLYGSDQEQLWDGFKNLPNLKIFVLRFMRCLIQTPNFHGIRNLKRFELSGCLYLKEIDSSIGSLEKLVSLRIEECKRLMMFPSISRLKNLETLSLQGCGSMFYLSEIKQNIGGTKVKNPGEDLVDVYKCYDEKECSLAHYNRKHIPLRVSYSLRQLIGLRKLNLSRCGLGNENIGSDIWELPNLQELYLCGNEFSCLDFSRLRLPQLKLLDVEKCVNLVSLSNLPSSIAVIDARSCRSLETFGEISDCKWLWKVRHYGGCNIDLSNGEMLLRDMLKGNAIEDHFISVNLPHQIPAGLVNMFFKGKSFTKRLLPHDCWNPMRNEKYTLHLPDDWYNDFCGFFMRVVTQCFRMQIEINIKQGPDEEDSRFELWQESYEAPEPQYDGYRLTTYTGYVSFGSLRRKASLDSSFNIISFSIEYDYSLFAAELVPINNKNDPVQTTDCSNIWDDHRESFKIQHDSKSCINILWKDNSRW